MLSFGSEVAAGASVDCLVCLQSFNIQASIAPEPQPAAAVPSAQKANPSVGARKKQAVELRAAGDPNRNFILAMIGLGLVVLLTAGAGASMWKRSAKPGDESRQDPLQQEVLAVNTKPAPESSPPVAPVPAADDVAAPPAPKKVPAAPDYVPPPPLRLPAKNDPPKEPAQKGPDAPKEKAAEIPGAIEAPAKPGKAPFALVGLDPSRPLPWGVDQSKIDAAIDRGVAYLKANQNADGSWGPAHPVGHAAIGGLTLLEGGLPPSDPAVQRAVKLVRDNVARLDQTYELALAILFLDRLGEPSDHFTIQFLALRLVAGQTASGGWDYQCPILNPNENIQLFTFLQATKKPGIFDKHPMMALAPKPGETKDLLVREQANPSDPVKDFSDQALLMATENPATSGPPARPRAPAKGPAAKGANPPAGKANVAAVQPNWLKQVLPTLPILQQQDTKKGKFKLSVARSDNSNTQFALLGLWVAGRHDVPAAQSLLGAHQRFVVSQHPDGGWNYQPAHPRGSTPSMTCVGLLGLALGHGAQPDVVGVNPKNKKEILIKPALQDARVQSGLKALARTIGAPAPKARPIPMHNLYELWSIERVAMLYELRSIGGKDWYGWGAQILLYNQHANGAWPVSAHYPGQNPSLNTCLAVLFLKRSNLAQDLTRSLQLESARRDLLRVDQDNSPP